MSVINIQKSQENDFEKQLEEDSECISVTSSAFIEDSEPSVKFLLEEKEDKFLTKVAMIFVLYFAVCAIVCLFIQLDMRRAKEWYRVFRLNRLLWVFFTISLIIKASFGFLGQWIRNFSKFAFLVDLILVSFITLGLYFHLEEFQRQYFIAYGHYVIMTCSCFFVMFVLFALSTIYRGRKKYNYWIGITVMTIGNFAVLILLDSFWISNPMKWDQFFKLFIVQFFITIYICLNGYMVLNFRTKKFFNHEFVYCFFCFWIDWFSFFWIDIVKNIKFIKKKLRKRRKRKRKNQKSKTEKKPKKKQIDNNLEIENEINKISGISVKNISRSASVKIKSIKKKSIKESIPDFENYQKSNLD